MSSWRIVPRRVRIFMAFLLAMLAPGYAFAQQYIPPTTPPVRETIDANGVDLTTGMLVSRVHNVSIGGVGNLGISFSRAITSTGSFRDSTSGSITFSGAVATVNFGTSTETFTLTGGNYVSNQQTGSTLTVSGGTYTYTLDNGTIILMSSLADLSTYGPLGITSVILPTGEVMTYNYKIVSVCLRTECTTTMTAARLQSVTSTNGYQLKMNFATDNTPQIVNDTKLWMTIAKVTGLNMSVDYCSPTSDTCSYSQTWPSLTMSGVTSFTDALSQVTTYTYTSGNLTGIRRTGAAADTTTIGYTSGMVTSVTNEGVATNYVYVDAAGFRTATISDAVAGNRIVKSDIANAQVTEDTNELGKKTTFDYDTTTRLLKKVTLPEGNTIEYLYDARGNVTKTTATAKAGSGLAAIVTEATYPASDGTQTWRCATGTPAVKCNKPITTKDAKLNVTDYTYDNTHGGITKVTLPAAATGGTRPETRYGYSATYYAQYKNSSGTLVNFATPVTRLTRVGACQTTASCTDAADETKTVISYGTSNVLPTSVASGSGNGTLTATSTIAYDNIGNTQTVDGPLSGTADTTRYYYDLVRRVIGVVGPDPDGAGALKYRAQKLTYTNNFLVLAEVGTATNQTDPTLSSFATLQQLTSTYDANARKMKDVLTAPTTATKYQVVKYSYDVLGRSECTALRMNTANWDGSQTACALEAAGTNGPDRITRTLYDAVGRLAQVQTAYGVTTANGYPATLQRNEATYTYSDNGKTATVNDAKNNLTTYEYDGFDRLTKTRYPSPTTPNSSSTTDYEQPTYDANGNVTAIRLRDGLNIAITFDNLNRPTVKDLPGTEPDVSFGYDLLGRLTSASQTGNALSWTYDALSRNLTQAGPLGTVTSTWDIGGRRTRLDLPGSFYTTYDYLVTGEMTAVRETGATSGPGVLATIAYDDLGQRTTLTRGNGTTTSYGFDGVSRLTGLTQNLASTPSDQTLGFVFNPASQILTRTASNDGYAFTQQWNANRAYTANGLNQYTLAGSATPTYDGRGNTASLGNGVYGYSSENLMTSAPNSVSLAYDPMTRLYQTTGGVTTRFLYDGSGTVMKRYVHGQETDEPLVWYEGSGTADRRWLHSDERGSVIAISDGSGSTIGINSYDEWGNPATGNIGRFQYTGQTWLPEIGMYYYKARIYNPRLGRFMQTDPIGYDDDMNLYSYVGDDPVNDLDSSGLEADCPQPADLCSNADIIVNGQRPGNSATSVDITGVIKAGAKLVVKAAKSVVCFIFGCKKNKSKPIVNNNAPQSKNCPAPPTPGAGKSTIDQNIADARLDAKVNALDPFQDPFGAVGYVNNLMQLSLAVTDASRQNYKKNPAFPGSAGYGNFNFGATMQARGFSLGEALGYSNAFQRLTTGRADPAEDVADLTNGYKYATGGC